MVAEDRTKLRAAAVIVVVLLVIGGGYVLWQSFKEPGTGAADFTVTTTGYEGGNTTEPWNFTLSEFSGKVVVLDMMAVNCLGCDIVAKDVIAPIFKKYGMRDDFAVLSVDVWAEGTGQWDLGGETVEDLIKFQKEFNSTWPHALDSDNVFQKYSLISIPTVVVIDKQGDIVLLNRGIPDTDKVMATIDDALVDQAETIFVVQLSLPLMALVAGIASFFAPCSVGLIPAYLGILLKGTEKSSDAERFTRTIVGGLLTAAGIVALYAVVALLLYLAADVVQPIIVNALPYVAIALILFGLSMFRTGMWDALAKKMGMGKVDGRRGFFAFGVGYGLAAFGCTGPVFLPVLLAGFAGGATYGFLVFGIYAIAVAALVLGAAALVASGHTAGLKRILSKTDAITKVAAVLVIVGAIWIWSKHFQATGSWF